MLTKSAYLEFLRCPNEFWLAHNSPSPKDDELSLEHKHRREQGYDVQRYAKKMSIFQTGIVSHELRFKTEDLDAKADIVVTDPVTQAISIYEVKSGASVKEEYIYDLAFQRMVAEAAGYTVAKTYLIIVDTSYIRNGDLDPDKLLKIEDVTDQVIAIQPATIEQAKSAVKYLETAPVANLAEYCEKKLECEFIQHHFTDIPEYNVTHIARLNREKCLDLLKQGIVDIRHVPADFKISDKQRRQVEIACGTEPYIDADAIQKELNELKYPLNFLDYESFSYAVPHFEGIRPYQQMLFQYSLHTIVEPGAKPTHRSRLSRPQSNGIRKTKDSTDSTDSTDSIDFLHPAREIAEGLHADLSNNVGTIIVWNKGFETMCTKQLALLYPEFCDFLASVNAAIYDLKTIFSNDLYMHPAFRGSASIKSVLPVLCPDLRYDALEIGDGTTASIKWYHMATKRFDEVECNRIFDSLFEYCHLDTLAMVRIWKVLRSFEPDAKSVVDPDSGNM